MTTADNNQSAVGTDPLVGKVLSGRFTLVELINRGGMGKIYKARQEPLGRFVALKILDVPDGGDEFHRRFFREASSCAKLTHPNTVRIYDYGQTDDGIYFIAMELIEGRTLQEIMDELGALDPRHVIHLALQLCGALVDAHESHIIHRDLKPANVLVTEHGRGPGFVKVVDFGLAKDLAGTDKVSHTGHVLGSPLYMAPEQVHNHDVDQRTDVYAVGLILYAMLTGKTAFKRGNPLAVLMAQVQQDPPTFAEASPGLNIPPALEWTVRVCLEKEMDRRFASMQELVRALKACSRELSGDLREPLELRLEDGRVVLPAGVDVSEDLRLHSGERGLLESVDPDTSTLASPTAEVTAAAEPTGGSRRASLVPMWVIGMVGAAVLGVVLVVLLLGPRTRPEAPPARAPAVVEQPPPPTPVEPQRIEVKLTTEPTGAEVLRDGALLGQTPFHARLGEDETLSVTVVLEGHKTRDVVLSAVVPKVALTLEPVAQARPASPRAEPDEEPKPRRRGDIRNPWDDP